MRIKREIQMGASGGGQSIKAGGIAARTGRTQTCNRHDSPNPKTPLTRGGRPHKFPPAVSRNELRCNPSPLPGLRISATRETTEGGTELEFRIQFPPAESRTNFATPSDCAWDLDREKAGQSARPLISLRGGEVPRVGVHVNRFGSFDTSISQTSISQYTVTSSLHIWSHH